MLATVIHAIPPWPDPQAVLSNRLKQYLQIDRRHTILTPRNGHFDVWESDLQECVRKTWAEVRDLPRVPAPHGPEFEEVCNDGDWSKLDGGDPHQTYGVTVCPSGSVVIYGRSGAFTEPTVSAPVD